jgi:5'-nucleotidase/UDP-sugar diphosphatase
LNKDDYPNIDRGFIHFSREIRYLIDKKCNDIRSIYVNEIPLENFYDKKFTIVMPNFVQGLARKWEETEASLGNTISNLRDINKTDTGLYARNELLNYIEKNEVTADSGFILDGRLQII